MGPDDNFTRSAQNILDQVLGFKAHLDYRIPILLDRECSLDHANC